MSSGEVAEFISELNETDSLSTLHRAHSEKSILIFKLDIYPNPIKTFIENFLDKRAILPRDLTELKLPTDKEVSIKFSVGTEIYFIKTLIKSHLNRYYFDMSLKVFQLKRRREPRFLVPKKWQQTACIVLNTAKLVQLKCTVIDISLSGIRLEIAKGQTTALYQRNDIIKIKFQIYKRAEIASTAIVRFVLNRPNFPILIGLELAEMPDIAIERVANIIEDINLANTNKKN